jgi:ABC-2 type transport system ATP-binding protein
VLTEALAGWSEKYSQVDVECWAVHGLIRESAASGAAVLLSSHVLAEAEVVADRVVVLREGRTVADRTVAEVVAGPPHRLTATFERPIDTRVLDRVVGVHVLSRRGTTLECSFPRRVLREVITALATVHLTDLRIQEADLDDWFRGGSTASTHRRRWHHDQWTDPRGDR